MFKTITAFKLDAATQGHLNALDEAIPQATVADPDKTQWSRAGFADVIQGPVFYGASGDRVFKVQIRERVLPGKVIRTHVLARAADLAMRQGSKCTRKQYAEIKEDVIASLLPTAFIKPVDILCLITGPYLMIGTGSARQVDVVLDLLHHDAYQDVLLTTSSIMVNRQVGKWMTELLLNETTDGGVFHCGESVVLKGKNKSAARFKDMDLASKAVQNSVENNMRPVEIAVKYKDEHGNDRVHFTVSDQLILKRIKFADILVNEIKEDSEGGDAATEFDATCAIVAGEMKDILDKLLAEMSEEEEL
jgi:recombination associated protein RdgC